MDRSQGGLGIGLTLVRQLVEMHSGRVEARSKGAGTGSEFLVVLPAMAERSDPSREPARPSKPDSPIKPRRILVVDDNVDFAASLKLLLEHEGQVVEVVHDGQSALDAAKTFSPDVVLMDLGLPGINGFETAHALRAMPEMRGALLIAVSGYAQDEDRRRSAREGFDNHLQKPVELQQILDAIRGG